jgi:hypothetical protein
MSSGWFDPTEPVQYNIGYCKTLNYCTLYCTTQATHCTVQSRLYASHKQSGLPNIITCKCCRPHLHQALHCNKPIHSLVFSWYLNAVQGTLLWFRCMPPRCSFTKYILLTMAKQYHSGYSVSCTHHIC